MTMRSLPRSPPSAGPADARAKSPQPNMPERLEKISRRLGPRRDGEVDHVIADESTKVQSDPMRARCPQRDSPAMPKASATRPTPAATLATIGAPGALAEGTTVT